MNANELADLLMEFDSGQVYNHATEIATMLRQQQAEIEVLKKFKAEVDADNKKLFEAVQKANEIWDRVRGVKNEQ